ncbi:hypothetical protein F2Q68_00003691 [Brassica cretica]|uniref:Uncharacterized protein n=2 Tax=Brassica cretica TaxID=69181 RepID=A0ABQ7CHG7_BRACR|nr:hypothetical protein F2Q68_00003691 [Brassica cretica]KAF3550981.1 hypothetical protein DY000_02005382 [Brassica cretica]
MILYNGKVMMMKMEMEKENGDEEEGDDDGGGGHFVYEPTGDRAMEALRDNITNEYGRGRLPY